MDRFSRTLAPTDPALKNIYLNLSRSTFHQSMLNPTYKDNIGLILAKNNYMSEAISDFKQVIKQDPRNTNAYAFLATLYETLKDSKSAIEYRQVLSKLDPYGAENLVLLEADYLSLGERQEAVTTRDSILGMAPGTDVAKRAAGLITK
jgi:tetratricopeptide (TPR) repeat protein